MPADKPFNAAVKGWYIGCGTGLATLCDILVAANEAMFSYTEVKTSFFSGINFNSRPPNPEQNRHRFYTHQRSNYPQPTYEAGHINKLVSAIELIYVAKDYTVRIASQASLPIRILKRFVAQAMPKGLTHRARIARAQVNAINNNEDGFEEINAFIEKRPQKFKVC